MERPTTKALLKPAIILFALLFMASFAGFKAMQSQQDIRSKGQVSAHPQPGNQLQGNLDVRADKQADDDPKQSENNKKSIEEADNEPITSRVNTDTTAQKVEVRKDATRLQPAAKLVKDLRITVNKVSETALRPLQNQ